MHRQASAAAATADQSFQQGSAFTRSPNNLVSRTVDCQPLLIRLVALPGDVGRETITEQYQTLVVGTNASPRARPARLFATRITGPIAVAIGAGVERVVQQILQGLAAGTMPFQLAPMGTTMRTHR